MASQKSSNISAEKLALFEKLLEAVPGVEKKGDTIPYTSLNGHMFCYLSKEDGSLALRLPEKEREAFMKKYKTKLMEAYGIIQKEYVRVPDNLFKKTKELQPYFKMSNDYVGFLKPRPTKPKATSKKAAKKK
jgi:hypothetical protein